jgi:hypothetical protein
LWIWWNLHVQCLQYTHLCPSWNICHFGFWYSTPQGTVNQHLELGQSQMHL